MQGLAAGCGSRGCGGAPKDVVGLLREAQRVGRGGGESGIGLPAAAAGVGEASAAHATPLVGTKRTPELLTLLMLLSLLLRLLQVHHPWLAPLPTPLWC